MAPTIQQVGMTSANQKMIEAALAALQGDAESSVGESTGKGQPSTSAQPPQQQQRGRQSSRASSSLEPEPEPEPAVAAGGAVTNWLASAIADVFGMEDVEEGREQMLPVATYMRSFESADDLAQYMLDIFEEAADEEDVEWLISSLDVQQARHDSGRMLATEDELNALWEASDDTIAKAEEAANAAAQRGKSRSTSLTAAEPKPQQSKPKPVDAIVRLNETGKRLRAKVTFSAGGTVDDVFAISVKVIRDGQVLARGKGNSPVGADGMRQTAKLAAATEALKAFPAELTESTDAWTESEPAAEVYGGVKDADWMDLKSAQKQAAISLGWKMGSWNNGDPTSACSKRWASLSQKGIRRPTVSLPCSRCGHLNPSRKLRHNLFHALRLTTY